MAKGKAFTLIELLVVIAIVALLMGVLLPALQRVRRQAKAVVCQAHLKQWATVLALYAHDNEGRIPSGAVVWLFRGSWLPDGDPNRPPAFHQLTTKGIACCPMAVRARTELGFGRYGSGSWEMRLRPGSAFRAWEIVSPPPRFRGSYGFNSGLGLKDGDIYFASDRTNMPVLLDCVSWSGRHSDYLDPPRSEPLGGEEDFCINRHNGYINGLFLDWSVRKIGLKELWTLKWHRRYDTANRWTTAGGATPEDWPEWMRSFKDY